MKFQYLIAVCCLAFVLVGCQNMQSVSYTCASATAALKTVIIFNEKLTPANRVIVAKASNIANPICSADDKPTLTEAAALTLRTAAGQLTAASVQVSQ